jgi:DNA/RNA-binding domain of Phe-tRNA-synthetase-like protein
MKQTYFRYSKPVLDRFSTLVGGVIMASAAVDEPAASLSSSFVEEQQLVKARIGNTPLSELKSLAAWRSAFRRFGVDPTQYRSAAEALLRRLTKQGDIPSLHPLVDIGNLVSIRYALPVAVFDARWIAGGITVDFAVGNEAFSDLGGSESIHPDVGEVVFRDESRAIHARRWCWRQSVQSAAQLTTTDVLITIEAHHEGARPDVEHAVADVLGLLQQYAGVDASRSSSTILSASSS